MQAKSSHNYSIDLLRVIAMAGVFLYHLQAEMFPHAYLGAAGFFCLAGFLSMRKVIMQATSRRRRLPIGVSLLNKFNKLWPPLVFMVLVVSLVMVVLFPAFLDNLAGQARSGLLGFNNLWQVLNGDSYFSGQGYVKPLTHLWALSLEMQFYLLFTLLVEWVYRQEQKYLWLVEFLLLAVFSYLCFWIFFDPQKISRVYYGTDSRFFSFALGQVAALVVYPLSPRPRQEAEPGVGEALRRGLLCFMLILLIGVYWLPLPLEIMLVYGLPLYSLLFCVTLMLAAPDLGFFSRVGASAPIQYFCSRSYYIFLWHYPVFIVSGRMLYSYNLPLPVYYLTLAAVALLLAELGYWVDRAFRRIFAAHAPGRQVKTSLSRSGSVLSLGLVLLIVFAPWQAIYEARGGDAFAALENDISQGEAALQARQQARRSAAGLSDPSTPVTTTTSRSTRSENTQPAPTRQERETPTLGTGPGGWTIKGSIQAPPTQEINPDDYATSEAIRYLEYFSAINEDLAVDSELYARYRNLAVSMIGDSVSVINSYHIFGYLPDLELDALSNRQTGDAYAVYEGMKANDQLGEILVIALGTNGDIDQEQLAQIWRDWQDKPLLMVNIVLPYQAQEAERNAAIQEFVEAHDQVYLVDWHGWSKGHPEYFQEDLIHPSDLGCKLYCQLIVQKLLEVIDLYDRSDRLMPPPTELTGTFPTT